MFTSGAKIQDLFTMVREQISDDAIMYTDTFLLSALNSALKLLAMEEDCQRLFKTKYQSELATINADGKPAARWKLTTPGEIVGKERMNFVTLDGTCYRDITPCYKTPKAFFSCFKIPEFECPGQPCAYTFEHINGETELIFDRPLGQLTAIEAVFYIIPRTITPDDIYIPISPSFIEAVAELVKIIINKEQTDFNVARSRYEDLDKHISDIAQKLAMQEMNDEPVFVNGFADTSIYDRTFGMGRIR